jgi:uncharacterized protein YdiU (UPF0061 family)
MLVGFVHGVMNTDNMTISGETIDYGPCAFLDAFDPATVYSSIDQGGRYAYGNQPPIAEWNLAVLAEALLPLLDDRQQQAVELAQGALSSFRQHYNAVWSAGMRAKLGLAGDRAAAVPAALVEDLLALLQQGRVDYTSFFRRLGGVVTDLARPDVVGADPGAADATGSLQSGHADVVALSAWVERWRALGPDTAAMARVNPVYIPRNHLVEEALTAATFDDLDPVRGLLTAVSRPYDERPGLERYAVGAPEDFGPYRTFCGT